MRGLSSISHPRPTQDPHAGRVKSWKMLAAAALVVPPLAYVAGTVSTAADEPAPREVLVLGDTTDPAAVEPRVVLKPAPPSPTPRPAPSRTPQRIDADCDDDDDDDDDVDVIRPCPEDLDDGDDDDWDDDDDGDNDDDDGDGDD